MFKEEVEARLRQLESPILFAHVGEPHPEAKVVRSWKEAWKRKGSLKSDNFFTKNYAAIHNDSLMKLGEKKQYEFFYARKALNKRLDDIMAAHPALSIVRQTFNDSDFERLWLSIRNDIGMACMEVQYEEELGKTYKPLFQDTFSWYLQGRVFCGWEGKHPEGRAVIF